MHARFDNYEQKDLLDMTKDPFSVFILGNRASGKTSFLLALGIIGDPNSDNALILRYLDSSTATVIEDLKTTAIEKGHWPAPSNTVSLIRLQLEYGFESCEINMLDFPGESLKEAVKSLPPDDSILQALSQADAVLVLIDPTQDIDVGLGNGEGVSGSRIGILAQALGYLCLQRKRVKHSPLYVGLVFTKSDLMEAEGIAAEDVFSENRRNFKKLTKYAGKHGHSKVFQVSVTGKPPSGNGFPSDPTPKGFDRIVSWILECKKDSALTPYKKWMLFGVVGLIIILAVVMGLKSSHLEYETQRIDTLTLQELVKEYGRKPNLPIPLVESLDERIDSELSRLDKEKAKSTTTEALLSIRNDLRVLGDLKSYRNHHKIGVALERVESDLEMSHYQRIRSADRENDGALLTRLVDDYRSLFPQGKRALEIQTILDKMNLDTRNELRAQIQAIRILNRQSLLSKSRKIDEYLERFPDDSSAGIMKKASEIAKSLTRDSKVRLRFTHCKYSETRKKQKHELRLYVGNSKDPLTIPGMKSDGKGRESTLDGHYDCDPDQQSLRLEIWETSGRNWKMAWDDLHVFQQLHRWDGSLQGFQYKNKYYTDTSVSFAMRIELPTGEGNAYEEVSKEDLDAYRDYVYPGDKWEQ